MHSCSQWLDVKAEIKLKDALENLMKGRNIPTLIIRSIDQKQVSVQQNWA